MTRYLDIIEAAYSLERETTDWLGEIRERVRVALGVSWVVAFQYEWSEADGFRVPQLVGDLDAGTTRDALQMMPSMYVPRFFQRGPYAELARRTFPNEVRAKNPFFESILPAAGLRDLGSLLAPIDVHRGVSLAVGYTRRTVWRAATVDTLARVAAHVSAAARLRAALQTADAAVLSEQGELLEGDDETQERARDLRRGVGDLVRAQSLRRASPEEAVATWRALVAGRWSLVASGSSAGKRVFLARCNEVLESEPGALTHLENQVVRLAAFGRQHKLIAYELGISQSSVSRHLTSAMRKLGARTPRELFELVAL